MRHAGKFTLGGESSPLSLMLDFCVYLVYRAEAAVLAALPMRFLFALGKAAGICGWLFFGKYRRLALHNVAIAFGNQKSPRERRRLVRHHFQRLCANVVCSIKLSSMSAQEILERVEVENFDAVHRELRAGVPVVLILSHMATWEVFAQLMPHFVNYTTVGTVFQKLGNRFIDAHMRRTRNRTGLKLFDRKEGFHPVIELLRSGGGVGILSDQHAGDQGLWTPFFGRLASTSSLPALLAKRSRAAIISSAVYTVGPGRWKMVFTDRIDTARVSVENLTLKINEVIEQQITHSPEDWLWAHNRWKTPSPNFLLAKYKRGVFLPSNFSKALKPFRILIRSSNWLGDAVMSVPAVRAIKAGRPDVHLTIAVPANIAPMWRLVSEVDEILSFETKSLIAAARLISRQAKFDVAILFPNSLRVALEVWLAGVPRRFGYRGHWRNWLLNQRMRDRPQLGPVKHHSHHYLRLAEKCGAETAGIRWPVPNRTSNHKGQTSKLGLCPGAEYGPAKRWLPERFAEAAKTIAAQQNVQWILFGTAKELELGKQIADSIGDNCLNLIGQTTLDQLIDQLRECRLLLTNDTGTMHLATLLGIPTVAIFGSTEPCLTGPMGNGHIVLRHQVECSPCFLRECPIDFRCMKAVSTQEVVDSIMSSLKPAKTPSNS